MRSTLPKVLQPLAGRPMLVRVLDRLGEAGFSRPAVLVGHGASRIRSDIGDVCVYVDQGEQLGTGHAARVALESLPSSVERILLVHGDEPMVDAVTYRQMLDIQSETGSPVVLLTTHVRDTRNFGRVVRDHQGNPVALLQESELSPAQKQLDEVNLGAYVFDAQFLRRHLSHLQPHAPKGEYFLTDVISLAVEEGETVVAITVEGGEDMMGINDLVQLEAAAERLYRETARRLMVNGVMIESASSTFIDDSVHIESGTVIRPFSVISGDVSIGRDCHIGPNAHIVDSRVGERCVIMASTVEDSVIHDDVRVGPYAHLRSGTVVQSHAHIGNYAEIKNSTIGAQSRMHHFSYVGDAQVGDDVNIGAGTVTCNFDGREKHRTVIEDGAFIGSDTMLRAPVTIGRGASTGAGSVVIRDVAAGSTVAGVPARVIKDAAGRQIDEGGDANRSGDAG